MSMQAYGNGIYVSITTLGDISTSIDGQTWTDPVSPFRSVDAYWWYTGIEFADKHFVAFGHRIVITNTAFPGNDWMSTLLLGGTWNSATFTGNNWVLVDDEGRTATSANAYPGDWTIVK